MGRWKNHAVWSIKEVSRLEGEPMLREIDWHLMDKLFLQATHGQDFHWCSWCQWNEKDAFGGEIRYGNQDGHGQNHWWCRSCVAELRHWSQHPALCPRLLSSITDSWTEWINQRQEIHPTWGRKFITNFAADELARRITQN